MTKSMLLLSMKQRHVNEKALESIAAALHELLPRHKPRNTREEKRGCSHNERRI
jgi:hypothetical protein